MSKKAAKKTSGSSNANPNVDRSLSAYPVEPSDLERQHSRMKKAAVTAKSALKPVLPMKVEFTAASTPSANPATPPKTSRPGREDSGSGESTKASRGAMSAAEQAPLQQGVQLKVVNVSFTFQRPGAKQVSLCGEFNDWSPNAGPMTCHEDGHWEAIVALRPGRYEYKFLVDGEWLTDPAVAQTVRNQFGSLNSVIVVEN